MQKMMVNHGQSYGSTSHHEKLKFLHGDWRESECESCGWSEDSGDTHYLIVGWQGVLGFLLMRSYMNTLWAEGKTMVVRDGRSSISKEFM